LTAGHLADLMADCWVARTVEMRGFPTGRSKAARLAETMEHWKDGPLVSYSAALMAAK